MSEAVRRVLDQRSTFEHEGPRPLARPIDEPEPFPLAALGPLRLPAEAVQAHTRAPIAICAQAVLGALALVGQGHADVVLPSGQVRPLSLFLMTIAASGERKSAVDSLALRAIYDYEEKLRAAYRADITQFEIEQAIWETQHTAAKAGMRGGRGKRGNDSYGAEADLRALGSSPEPPLMPLLLCPEPTFEGYCKLTAIGQPAMGLFSAEGGSFIGGHGMSMDHRLKTAAGISSVWDGDPIKRVRAGDGSIVLDGRRLSLHLMAQPDVAAQLLDDSLLLNQGLLSRILVVFPLSTAGTRFFAEPSLAARTDLKRYEERLAELAHVPLPLKVDTRNELDPRKLVLTAEATQVWINLHDFIEEQLAPNGDFEPIAGLANKAAEHAARIAGLLTLWIDVEAREIGSSMMVNAAYLIQHYLAEAVRLRSMASTNRHLKLAQRVLDWLIEKWEEPAVYPAVIYNDCTIREVRDRRTALQIISTLENHGWLIRLEEPTRIKGSVRKEAWLIHGRTLR
ncbi:MAG: DUF3987 domain-containing protein [Hyphomicrobiales bacterium]|nr:DUF3987 domain-containing protein [Hyphomicrobiales bacterium]